MTVVNSRCGCCGEKTFIENRDAYEARMVSGEAIFCQDCLDLPEEEAEEKILWQDPFNLIERARAILVMDHDRYAELAASETETTRQAAT